MGEQREKLRVLDLFSGPVRMHTMTQKPHTYRLLGKILSLSGWGVADKAICPDSGHARTKIRTR